MAMLSHVVGLRLHYYVTTAGGSVTGLSIATQRAASSDGISIPLMRLRRQASDSNSETYHLARCILVVTVCAVLYCTVLTK